MILRKFFVKKNKGNVTSLLYGQMFVLLTIIWGMFNFRLILINTMFDYLDDSLTSSILGGALVNTEEYGKSNQLIIHDNDEYKNTTRNPSYNGWEPAEADILLSEMNYGSSIQLEYSNLEYKQVLDTESRDYLDEGATTGLRTSAENDLYMRRSLSAYTGNMIHNTSNGRASSTYNSQNIISNISSLGSLTSSDTFSLQHDILKESILGQFVASDIEITRFDIYNVYRANTAEKHVYASEYMLYNGSKYEAYMNRLNDVTTIAWDTAKYGNAGDQDAFDGIYLPCEYEVESGYEPEGANRSCTFNVTNLELHYVYEDGVPKENEQYGAQLEKYEKRLNRWKIDSECYNKYGHTGNLVCFTDTRTSFQGKYNPERVKYKYFYSEDGHVVTTSTNKADLITPDEKAPIVAYTVYSYKSPNSEFGYAGGTTFTAKTSYITKGAVTDEIEVQGGKRDGDTINNTSLYSEITFDIKIFPSWNSWLTHKVSKSSNDVIKVDDDPTEKVFSIADMTKRVTVSRLVDIELYLEEDY